MFIISQLLLHKSKMCNQENISTYAIAIGLVIYASIYLYLLFYQNDYVFMFNKFIIYIISIDLLLSTFYYFNSNEKTSNIEQHTLNNLEKLDNLENLETVQMLKYSDEEASEISDNAEIESDELNSEDQLEEDQSEQDHSEELVEEPEESVEEEPLDEPEPEQQQQQEDIQIKPETQEEPTIQNKISEKSIFEKEKEELLSEQPKKRRNKKYLNVM